MKNYGTVMLALAVVAGGTSLALLFRLDQREPPPPDSGDNLEVASQTPDGSAETAQSALPQTHFKDESPKPQRGKPPSQSAQSNSRGSRSSNPVKGQSGSGRRAGSKAGPRPPRTHKIVDGDSLQEIARQYLGSASLAGEIFAVNRTRLSDPALLPIGVELTIPSGVRKTGTSSGSPNRRPLVPVAPGPRDRSAAVGPSP